MLDMVTTKCHPVWVLAASWLWTIPSFPHGDHLEPVACWDGYQRQRQGFGDILGTAMLYSDSYSVLIVEIKQRLESWQTEKAWAREALTQRWSGSLPHRDGSTAPSSGFRAPPARSW